MKLALCLTTAFYCLLLSMSPALAQNVDYPCYMQGENRLVDLSKLCGQPVSMPANSAFVSDFQTLAGQYPTQVNQALSQYIGQNQGSAIAAAKTTCRVVKFGGSTATETRQRALLAYNNSPVDQAKQQITADLATTHFCP
ncbi:DUF732 domain-containing protein [Phormidesmis sp. 146-35]